MVSTLKKSRGNPNLPEVSGHRDTGKFLGGVMGCANHINLVFADNSMEFIHRFKPRHLPGATGDICVDSQIGYFFHYKPEVSPAGGSRHPPFMNLVVAIGQ